MFISPGLCSGCAASMASMDVDPRDSDIESDDGAFVEDDDQVIGDLTGGPGIPKLSPLLW